MFCEAIYLSLSNLNIIIASWMELASSCLENKLRKKMEHLFSWYLQYQENII